MVKIEDRVLEQLVLRLEERSDISISHHTSEPQSTPFIKISGSKCQIFSYSPSAFIVIKLVQQRSPRIRTLFLAYNEELVEEREFSGGNDEDSEGIYQYILERIEQSPVELCAGVVESSLANVSIQLKDTLIEKHGKTVTYRSRGCSRVVSSQCTSQLCLHCQAWIQKNLEDQTWIQKCQDEMTGSNLKKDIEEDCKQPACTTELQEFRDETAEFNVDMPDDDNPLDEEDFGEDSVTLLGLQDEDSYALASFKHKRCVTCQKKCKNYPELHKHMRECCSPLQLCACDYCDHLAPTQAQLKLHLKKHVAVQGTFLCPVPECGKIFKIHMGKSMRNHLESLHRIDPDSPPEELKEKFLPSSEDVPRLLGRRLYPCPVEGCSYIGKDITSMRYHQPVHTGEKIFCCDMCGKSFRYKKELYLCEKRHKGELNFFCDHCDKRFLSKKKLDLHIRVHTGEKPFNCPMCDFKCSRKDNLNTHTKKHHGLPLKDAAASLNFVSVCEVKVLHCEQARPSVEEIL